MNKKKRHERRIGQSHIPFTRRCLLRLAAFSAICQHLPRFVCANAMDVSRNQMYSLGIQHQHCASFLSMNMNIHITYIRITLIMHAKPSHNSMDESLRAMDPNHCASGCNTLGCLKFRNGRENVAEKWAESGKNVAAYGKNQKSIKWRMCVCVCEWVPIRNMSCWLTYFLVCCYKSKMYDNAVVMFRAFWKLVRILIVSTHIRSYEEK